MSLFRVNSNGVITVDYTDIQQTFQEAFKNALGSDLNLDVSTPQGQLIQVHTQVVNEIQTDIVNLANSFNPYTAEGDALDNTGAFFGYYRKANQPTVVVATITGTAGTVIPAGSRASNSEHEFETLDNITIPNSGRTTVEFQCVDSGAISCVAGSLNTIVTTISGWDTINNANDGVVGYEKESDNEFRGRITANWLNIRAISVLGSIIDSIAQLNGVVSVIGRENPKSVTQVIDGLSLVPHSIWLTVLGGNEDEIAKILTEKKTLGCDTNGNTSITYTDPVVNYDYVYNIRRPLVVPVYIQVNYEKNVYTPIDVEDRVKNLIMQYIGENSLKIGQKITGAWLSNALDNYNQLNLLSIKTRINTSDEWADFSPITLEQVGNISIENITVVEA